jgi:cobaltochelatase CobN
MTKRKFKKIAIITLLLIVVIGGIWTAYSKFMSPTKIAVVNFPGFTVEKMMRANTNNWVEIKPLDLSEINKIERYPLVLIRGHGVRISPEQLDQIREASEKGVKIYVADVTNPEYDLSNLQGEELDYIADLLDNKGSKNFRSLFNYTRQKIDNKKLFLQAYDSAEIFPDDYFFYTEDDQIFDTAEKYENFYRENGLYKEDGARVALLAGNINIQNSNAEHTLKLIKGLEAKGLNVFPIRSFGIKKLELLKSCKPDIVLLRPHGRLAMGHQDKAVDWLKEQNIPVLTPLTVYGEYDKWLKDPQGMFGGMLTMSVVMPELDGAVAPYAVVAQYKTKSGNLIYDGIDNRIENFSELVAKWAHLQTAKNKDKKVAIYYFKGPGKNSLVASGLEVIPSLYTVLQELKSKGYNLAGLPETKEAFENMIMKKGPVLGPYAHGAFDEYLKTGEPVLVEKETYENWCKQAMPAELYKTVTEKYGEAPGDYMKVEKDRKEYIAVTALRFGNVTLLPQPLPGIGNDEQQLIHGANTAPPHSYIASYLWTRFGFEADAVFHFGTHGSLEFTPGKQVALSDYDWADRLIGTSPHFYNYTINNIGEGIIAKRRSYATLLTYLTPPFMKSGLNKDLESLSGKLDSYNSLPGGPVREQYAVSIKELAEKLNIHRALRLDSTRNYTGNDIHKIHEYLEEIEEEKITAGLYTMGIPYSKTKLENSALLMSTDPVAFSLAELDLLRNRITREQYSDALYVSTNYRPKARSIIQKAMHGNDTDKLISQLVTNKELTMANKWKAEHKDTDLLALMMKKERKKEKEEIHTDADRLPELIVKLCSDEKNKAYIEKLKSDKVFEKSSKMLDAGKRKKALKMAEKMKTMAPEMYESVSIANQPDMLELLQLMQDSVLRAKTFELMADNQLAGKIEAQKQQLLKENAARLDSAQYTAWINRIYNNDFKKETEKFDLDELKKGLKIIDFIYSKVTSFEYCSNALYSEKYADKQRWNKTFDEAKSLLNDAIAAKEERLERYAKAVLKLEETINNARQNKINLKESADKELASVINALNGGYTAPSSGGDPIVNPKALPTGRNMYAVDAERTPSEEAWKVGKKLANSLLEKEKELKGRYPRKVSFTLWSNNFISTEGATIAQILYLLGVEPVRDGFGTVRNLKLIPIEELGRPRIDVVIQTSGQLRDIAASRLDLINKAITLAAEAKDNDSLNFVKTGFADAEKYLIEQGFSPKDARKYASKRVFGGVNGNYGAGIMGLVEKGDAWDDEKQLAEQYINNMGAIYESGEDWGAFRKGIFEAALQNTETVVQPRSSNTWGPLSLDHVYEFMGGINMAVRNVTGNDPTAYFNDFRNVSRPKMQELKEAIGVETNSTVFNPKYIKELLDGEASSMEEFAETFRNTYGWNVMKPNAIDDHIWNSYHDIYVNDKLNLNVRERFETENPYALQEMTTVMLETARKGYWNASDKQLSELTQLHAELVRDHEAGCSGFVCDNAKLRAFIAEKLPSELSENYTEAIDRARNSKIENTGESVVLKKENEQTEQSKSDKQNKPFETNNVWLIAAGVLFVLLLLLAIFIRNRKRK